MKPIQSIPEDQRARYAAQTYRDFKITTGQYGFNVESINCFGCHDIEQARSMIDIYIDGNNNPQCLPE